MRNASTILELTPLIDSFIIFIGITPLLVKFSVSIHLCIRDVAYVERIERHEALAVITGHGVAPVALESGKKRSELH